MSEAPGVCRACGRALEADHRFCPGCGRARETAAGEFSPSRFYLAGALLFAVPDAAILCLASHWLPAGGAWEAAGRFLAMDLAAGLLAAALLRLGGQRGAPGDLILLGLRCGQITIAQGLRLAPFGPGLETLTLLLFLGLPCIAAILSAAVWRRHVSGFIARCGGRDRT